MIPCLPNIETCAMLPVMSSRYIALSNDTELLKSLTLESSSLENLPFQSFAITCCPFAFVSSLPEL